MIASSRFPIREPFAGGLEAHTFSLARELDRRGHEVAVFAAPGSQLGVPVTELPVGTYRSSEAARADVGAPPVEWMQEHHAYLSLMMRLAQHGAEDYDLVLNNSLHHLPVAMAPTVPIPVVTILHTPPVPWLESAINVAGGAGTFVAVSEAMSRAWAHAVRTVTILNGVDPERWTPGPGGADAVWSGRIAPEKAPHEAIEAARRSGRAICLAGPVMDQCYFDAEIRPRLDDSVRYVGHLDQRDLCRLVGSSAVALVTPDVGRAVRSRRRRGDVVRHSGRRISDAAGCRRWSRPRPDGWPRRTTPWRWPVPWRRPPSSTAGPSATMPSPPTGWTGWSTSTRPSCSRPCRRKQRDRLLRPPCRGRSPSSCPGGRRADLEHRHGALLAVAARRTGPVRGCGWPGTTRHGTSLDPTAGGRLHWVPEGDAGLRRRMAALSAWIDTAHPDVLVSDVSVEVTLLARLHGIPVVSVVLPGHRGDRAHRDAFAVSSGLVATWPSEATGMVRGLAPTERRRLRCVGGLSRLPLGDHRRPIGRSLGPGPVGSRRRAPHRSSAACGGRRRPGVELAVPRRAR